MGSGTGFYTDRIAALTTGTVYALEIVPEMNAHHRERGLPGNVRLVHGDMTALSDETPLPLPGAIQAPDLAPPSIDVAVTIATWHEIDGQLDVPGGRAPSAARWPPDRDRLAQRPRTWDYGPPGERALLRGRGRPPTLAGHFRVAIGGERGGLHVRSHCAARLAGTDGAASRGRLQTPQPRPASARLSRPDRSHRSAGA